MYKLFLLGVEVVTGLASNCKLFALVVPFAVFALVIVAVASAFVFFDVSESTDTGCANRDAAVCGDDDDCFFPVVVDVVADADALAVPYFVVFARMLDDGAETVYMLYALMCVL